MAPASAAAWRRSRRVSAGSFQRVSMKRVIDV